MPTTKQKIITLLQNHTQLSIKQLSEALDISLSMTHRHVKNLLENGSIKKIGSAPRVFYVLSPQNTPLLNKVYFPKNIHLILNKNFLLISPSGERIDGVDGFVVWCEKRGFDPIKKVKDYITIYKKYHSTNKNGLISGKQKILNAFDKNTCLDDVFYAGFYTWEIFGKTKLGQLLLYAKQGQNRKMIKEVVEEVEPIIQKIIKLKKIDAIGFIPPTVKRQTQFMKVFEKTLSFDLPKIQIVKIKTEIITPQKTLSRLPDRIENATNTIFVTEKNYYKNILLLDDAVGSGATLNQVACKIKKAKVAKKVYGFTITGSAKGFDVISEI